MTITDNFKQAWGLTKETFALIKTDKSLLWPPLFMFLFQLILPILFIVIGISSMQTKGLFIAFAIFLIFVYVILSFFVNAFFGAALSWMIYETKTTGSTTFFSGIWRALKNIIDVIIFGIVSVLIAQAVAAMRRRRRGLFTVIIGSLFAGIARELWDLVGNLTLPSMIISENSFFQAIKESKKAARYLPESLIGIFVFDAIANYLYFIGFLGGAIAGLITYFLSSIIPAIFIGIAAMIIICSMIGLVKNYVKSSYFTLLYMQIQSSVRGKKGFKQFSLKELKKGIVSIKKKIGF